MEKTINIPDNIRSLTDAEVLASREKFGTNEQQHKIPHTWRHTLIDLLKEPMLILLISVAVIYFIMGQNGEAYFMLAAIVIVSGISFYQDNRSRKALEALEALVEPLSRVLRNGRVQKIPTKDIVVGDMVIVDEGNIINADGQIVHSNDFSVNESMLTGEAFSVFKSTATEDNRVYSGTVVASGLAVYKVEKTGKNTRLGQLGSSILEIRETATPLQLQIENFVKIMAIAGIAVFVLVWAVNYWESRSLLNSLLKGLTLAMSILPEEIPVAFTTFMALGSWRLMREGVIVKRIRTVETLGSATVLCTDKTGTITENKMHLQAVYAHSNKKLYEDDNWKDDDARQVIDTAMWASEPVPFDPMEKTLHQAYEIIGSLDERRQYRMVHEYPLEGIPPMMTHIFENGAGKRIIAAKGAPEAILAVSDLSESETVALQQVMEKLATKGYRMLGVARADDGLQQYPKRQQDIHFHFMGLVVFHDPPKANIREVCEHFYEAGIDIKLITGDNPVTTKAIAEKAGIHHPETAINGQDLVHLDEKELIKKIHDTNLFTRTFPEAKLIIIDALKKDNQVVAMVGDGINDGPALKSAHIGIAMGKKGTEIAKSAADLILVNDDLSKMVDAVAAGRRIYANIKKAVQYIISIHIPIILTVSLPLFFGWVYPNIFTPVHVIFLELIMGPMCSIVYENEPIEKNIMSQPPRPVSKTFLQLNEMGISIIQGLVITAGVLFMYQFTVRNGGSEALTRSMVFTTLVFSNVLLSLANRSFHFSIFSTLRYKNNMMFILNILTLGLLGFIIYVHPVTDFFDMVHLNGQHLLYCLIAAFISVMWIEGWKWIRRERGK